MERRHQPRSDLRESRPGLPTAVRRVRGKFPRIQYRPSLITPSRLKVPGHSDPVKPWNFRNLIGSVFAFSQVNLLRDCHLRTHQIFRGHTRIFERAYYLRPNNVFHVAVGRTMCHTGTRGARPSIALSSENKWGRTLIEPPCPNYLDLNKETGAMGEHCQFHQRLALQPQCVEIHQQMHWQVSTLLLPVPCLGTFHRLTTSEERGTQVWGL